MIDSYIYIYGSLGVASFKSGDIPETQRIQKYSRRMSEGEQESGKKERGREKEVMAVKENYIQ